MRLLIEVRQECRCGDRRRVELDLLESPHHQLPPWEGHEGHDADNGPPPPPPAGDGPPG